MESPLKKFKEFDSYTRLKSSSIPPTSTSMTRLQGDVTIDDDVNNDVTHGRNGISAFKRKFTTSVFSSSKQSLTHEASGYTLSY